MKTNQAHPLLRIQASYDENSRLSGQGWQMGDETYSEGVVYDDYGRLTSKSVTLANGSTSTMTNSYDALSRLSAQTRPMSRITYSYLAGANGTTTGLVSSVTHSKVGSNSFSPITFGYAYDELGYITSYTQTGKQAVTYDYDVQGQLTSVSDPNQDLYYSYEYDTYGNIRSAEAHGSYHTSDNYTNDYEYNNPKWLDLLTGFNDEPILYEGQTLVDGEIVGDPTSGNPISYFNGTRWEFVWQNGRQLASASTTDGDTTIAIDYTYDINGLRTSKTITRTTGGGTAHTHEYTSAVTAPTCTTAGYTTYTCDCGESYVDSLVDALGHNYVQSGNVYTCSRCGDSYTGHEHSYTEETTEPTCTTAGYTVYTCSCGDSYTVDIPALGHNYVLVNQNGTVGTYRCSRCGHTYSAIIPVTPPSTEYSLRSATVTTEYHEYIYASGKLLREVITTTDEDGNVTTEILDFTYDASGSPYTVTRIVGTSSSTYYYVVNPQGDVIRLVSANGATVAEYAYDPWGRVISATGTMAEVNPLRYRGYCYDVETEFYYLQSRYYDPAICRFINADGYASTGQGFLGQNMFAYCLCNPINLLDGGGFIAQGAPMTVYIDEGGSDGNYLTPEMAARAFAEQHFALTAGIGREQYAFIYAVETAYGLRYNYGYISYGTSGTCLPLFYPDKAGFVKNGNIIVGDIHTHPIGIGDNEFSEHDIASAQYAIIQFEDQGLVQDDSSLVYTSFLVAQSGVYLYTDSTESNDGAGKFVSSFFYIAYYPPFGGQREPHQATRVSSMN